MAKGNGISHRPDVASRSVFDALKVDDGESSESESELDTPSPPAPALLAPPSKKARQRQQASLKKKASSAKLSQDQATDSDASLSPSTASIAPVPSLPTKLNGQLPSRDKVEAVATKVKEDAVNKAKEATQAIKASLLASTPRVAREQPAPDPSPAQAIQDSTNTVPTFAIPDSASSSDAEDADNYSDDASEASDEEDEEPSPSPTPNIPSPSLPASPITSRAGDPSTSTPTSPSTPTTPGATTGEVYTGADHEPSKKIQSIITRTLYSLLMILGFVTILSLGHVYVIMLVFACQAVVFSELTALFDAAPAGGQVGGDATTQKERERELRRKGRKEERDRWSRRISWYFFAATNYFLYGESLIYYFKHILTLQASFLPTTFSFAQHHRLLSFGLYIIGFVSFVANLKRAQLRRQFGLFGWIHMSLLLVIVSSHFIVNNILEGLIWFFVPCSLVIMNDIAAYVCGMLFGRHQLIKLSPKKTVEGFVGAFFVTMIFAVVWGTFFMRFNYMICPVQDLATNILSDMKCTPNQVFVWRSFPLPSWAVSFLSAIVPAHARQTHRTFTSIPWAPFQLHSIVMAIFASLVAPFGGFFASGFKRAFNIKDFGDSIPGHGGMTDRMDCQFLMGLFSYVYYASLIRETHVTVASVFSSAVTSLTTEQQLELVKDLTKYLAGKGLKAAVPW
ncbi:phosphatidate cytidylyltransferase, partial [Phenoliferia sp. Uapishka_3]